MSSTLALSLADLIEQPSRAAGVALVVLFIAGWRKFARAQARDPSKVGRTSKLAETLRRPPSHFAVEHRDVSDYRSPGVVRRCAALVGTGVIGVVVGALAAVVIGGGIALAVIVFTSMLQ